MYIVIHYSEIGLKGKNRNYFEKKLIQNIKGLLVGTRKIYRKYGKIILEVDKKTSLKKCREVLTKIPGISSFAFAQKSELKIGSIKKKTLDILSKKHFKTFRITCRRSNKLFSTSSQEINVLLGDLVVKQLGKKVQLNDPGINFFVEISEKEAFLYTKKYAGMGGLPVGSSGRAIVSLSGGIDSPVASFFAMKRGVKVIFVHILNQTVLGEQDIKGKIEDIVGQLAKFQGKSKLYIVPFSEIQKTIIANIPAESRMIVYRRFMMKIIEKIATIEKAKGIITGDSIGQVASQTLDNLKCVYAGLDLPVLPPLIGMNKEEIIKIAKEIGTYELSILPYPDCCSFMIAKHPETKARLEAIKKLESFIPECSRLIEKSVADATVKLIDFNL